MSGSEDPHDREARTARNRTAFRELSERSAPDDASGLVVPAGEWMCECANDTCLERIEMTVEEYEAVRRSGVRFFVTSSDEHFQPDIERVIEHNDRYWIVEHTGPAAATADSPASDRQRLPLHT